MDKRADIHPDHTPDMENKLLSGEKRGTEHEAVEQLDDDVLNRMAKTAAGHVRPRCFVHKPLAQ